ncbi:MAG: hypothetical protein U0Q18_12320 [Bryobacteraceae bacterium]
MRVGTLAASNPVRATGPPREYLRATTAAWSADGDRLAYIQGGTLYVANADGTAPASMLTLPLELAAHLRWHSDGCHLRLVLWDKQSQHGRLWDIDLENRRRALFARLEQTSG